MLCFNWQKVPISPHPHADLTTQDDIPTIVVGGLVMVFCKNTGMLHLGPTALGPTATATTCDPVSHGRLPPDRLLPPPKPPDPASNPVPSYVWYRHRTSAWHPTLLQKYMCGSPTPAWHRTPLQKGSCPMWWWIHAMHPCAARSAQLTAVCMVLGSHVCFRPYMGDW